MTEDCFLFLFTFTIPPPHIRSAPPFTQGRLFVSLIITQIGRENKEMRLRAFKYAFPKTIPILMGFLFLGMSYGFYMRVSGFSFFFPLVMSIVIFGSSLELLTVACFFLPLPPFRHFLLP